MWMGNGFGWGGMILGGLMMLLFWGGLIALLVLAVRAVVKPGASTPEGRTETAVDILKGRYAKGEITRAEYEEIRHTLQN